MVSGTECPPVPDAPFSRPEEPRAANASRPEIGSLKTAGEYRRVLSSGIRRRVGDVIVVAASGVPGRVRVGLVAGKRTGSAVQRNRAKRRLRQAVAQAGLPSGDYVVIAGPDTVSVPFSQLVEWLHLAAGR